MTHNNYEKNMYYPLLLIITRNTKSQCRGLISDNVKIDRIQSQYHAVNLDYKIVFFMWIISEMILSLKWISSSKISTLSQSKSCENFKRCSVITELWFVFLQMWLRCSSILVLSSLRVCPTYDASHWAQCNL